MNGTQKHPLTLLVVGALSSAAVVLVPLVDLMTVDSVASHVRDAYPQWPSSEVEKDRVAIVSYVVGVGVVGLAGWIWSILLAYRGSRRTFAVSVILLALGAVLGCMGFMGGEAYDTIVPPAYGSLTLLPVAIGAGALYRLRSSRPQRRGPLDTAASGSASRAV